MTMKVDIFFMGTAFLLDKIRVSTNLAAQYLVLISIRLNIVSSMTVYSVFHVFHDQCHDMMEIYHGQLFSVHCTNKFSELLSFLSSCVKTLVRKSEIAFAGDFDLSLFTLGGARAAAAGGWT